MARRKQIVNVNEIRYRRIVLQIDASSHCTETFAAAIDIAARLHAELHGVFIEDRDLISVGRLDFVREFRLSSPMGRPLDEITLDAQLKAMARSVRRQLEHAGTHRQVEVRFKTIRGDIHKELADLTSDDDLVVVEGTGRLHKRLYRARLPGRTFAQNLIRPTLFLKAGRALAKSIVVLCDNVDSVIPCLRAADLLAGEEEKEIAILPYASTGIEAERLSDQIGDLVNEKNSGVHIAAPAHQGVDEILYRLKHTDSLLIVSEDSPLLREETAARNLMQSQHPILIVHQPRDR